MPRAGAGLVLVLLVLLVVSCVPPPAIDLSRPVDPSRPVAELDVQPLLEGMGVRVGIAVWHPTLAFVADDEGWTAGYAVVLRAWKRNGRRLAAEQTAERTVTVATRDATTTLQSDDVALTLDLPPGTYWITATVRDRNARTESVVGAVATVRPVEVVAPYRVQVLVGVPPAPVYSRTLLADGQPAHLRVRTEKDAAFQVTVAHVLLPPEPASPPAGPGLAESSLMWQPVAQQAVQAGAREASLELGALAPGAYRWQVRAEGRLWQSGTWVVRDVTFPVVTQWAEMVAALRYIATPEEVEALRTVVPEQRRARFEAFWQSDQRANAEANKAVQVFAERLEAANLRFSETRSGWQTERGMVYTVLGPPFFVERDYNLEVWEYRLDPTSERVTEFVFIRSTETGQWRLRRESAYAEPWAAAVARWRTGRVGR
ncbi:MAG: GWxTD domain-containing protein [Bacteroidota bacterium]